MGEIHQQKRRKLSKPLRRANLVYKIIMAVLAGVSFSLATLTDTHTLYYQIVSVLSSAFPVVWTQILDACKQYEDDRTPSPSPEAPKSPEV